MPRDLKPLLEVLPAVVREELLSTVGNATASDEVLDQLCRRHPAWADEIRALWSALCSQRIVGLDPALVGGDGPETPGVAPSIEPGERWGDFEIVREIGRGGMGVVYLAQQLSIARPVALKLLPATRIADRRARDYFAREVRLHARVDHPAIVPLLDAGEFAGVPYLAMRFVEGASLEEWLAAQAADSESASHATETQGEAAAYNLFRDNAGPNRNRAIVGLFAALADALQHAHDRGILHRDVKPGNILVDRRGQPYLLDFGLARLTEDEAHSERGRLVGSPAYLSPEQMVSDWIKVDHRTDVYSLGASLYHALAGHPPFTATSIPALLRAIQWDDPKALRRIDPTIPVDLERVVAMAMAKAPHQRYATAAEFAADLRRILGYEAVRARPVSRISRVARYAKRYRRSLFRAAVAGLVVGAGLGGLSWLEEQARQAAARVAERNEELWRDGAAAVGAALDRGDLVVARDALSSLREWTGEVPGAADQHADLMVRFDRAVEERLADAQRLEDQGSLQEARQALDLFRDWEELAARIRPRRQRLVERIESEEALRLFRSDDAWLRRRAGERLLADLLLGKPPLAGQKEGLREVIVNPGEWGTMLVSVQAALLIGPEESEVALRTRFTSEGDEWEYAPLIALVAAVGGRRDWLPLIRRHPASGSGDLGFLLYSPMGLSHQLRDLVPVGYLDELPAVLKWFEFTMRLIEDRPRFEPVDPALRDPSAGPPVVLMDDRSYSRRYRISAAMIMGFARLMLADPEVIHEVPDWLRRGRLSADRYFAIRLVGFLDDPRHDAAVLELLTGDSAEDLESDTRALAILGLAKPGHSGLGAALVSTPPERLDLGDRWVVAEALALWRASEPGAEEWIARAMPLLGDGWPAHRERIAQHGFSVTATLRFLLPPDAVVQEFVSMDGRAPAGGFLRQDVFFRPFPVLSAWRPITDWQLDTATARDFERLPFPWLRERWLLEHASEDAASIRGLLSEARDAPSAGVRRQAMVAQARTSPSEELVEFLRDGSGIGSNSPRVLAALASAQLAMGRADAAREVLGDLAGRWHLCVDWVEEQLPTEFRDEFRAAHLAALDERLLVLLEVADEDRFAEGVRHWRLAVESGWSPPKATDLLRERVASLSTRDVEERAPTWLWESGPEGFRRLDGVARTLFAVAGATLALDLAACAGLAGLREWSGLFVARLEADLAKVSNATGEQLDLPWPERIPGSLDFGESAEVQWVPPRPPSNWLEALTWVRAVELRELALRSLAAAPEQFLVEATAALDDLDDPSCWSAIRSAVRARELETGKPELTGLHLLARWRSAAAMDLLPFSIEDRSSPDVDGRGTGMSDDESQARADAMQYATIQVLLGAQEDPRALEWLQEVSRAVPPEILVEFGGALALEAEHRGRVESRPFRRKSRDELIVRVREVLQQAGVSQELLDGFQWADDSGEGATVSLDTACSPSTLHPTSRGGLIAWLRGLRGADRQTAWPRIRALLDDPSLRVRAEAARVLVDSGADVPVEPVLREARQVYGEEPRLDRALARLELARGERAAAVERLTGILERWVVPSDYLADGFFDPIREDLR